jgi:solute carrier family 7 (L-type amino acid transporter), member 6
MDAEEGQQLLGEPHQHQTTSDEGFQSAAVLSAASDDDLSSASGERPGNGGPLRPPRFLTLFNGFALVVGLQIGSGIFSAPSVVISKLLSPITAIFAWFLAGVFVWAGASSFIELGTRVPHNGGMQEYLRYCYGDAYGFLFAWVWLLVSRPCGMAMVALVFSEYFFRGVLPDQDVSTWILKAVALLAIILISFLNCMGTQVGTGSATVFLVLKTFGLGSIIIFGLVFQVTASKHQDGIHHRNGTEQSWLTPSSPAVTDTGYSWLWMSLGDFTDALFAALFAYAGWESVSD